MIVFLSIVAILVAVFVLDADFDSTPRPILVVVTPAVAISLRAVIGARPPISTYRTVVLVRIVSPHPVPHSTHVVLAHVPRVVADVRVRSPIWTNPSIFGALSVLLAGLIRLLGCALWLHRSSLGVARGRRLRLILGE